jgi:DNA-directed RNA polymerase subunit RPC12/RpoP
LTADDTEVREMVTCARCGTTAEELPLTWSSSSEPRGTVYYCDTCSRENLRSIEGRLDEEWWA